ncbi:PREDICTED: apyrase-like [Amphimedon queenslandica]|uniref:Uncharacterized protein n=1 Tax=Amphimedon queenslandica TaxID=400682 RepID=A0AAN0K4P6_AMPQE|nr:PREDICTED: apyrase-like [Amphimedon queenslandica]|eukprot:XP_019864144.1 PREDICTED: apyrase-like [Amphimedon queenslandica]
MDSGGPVIRRIPQKAVFALLFTLVILIIVLLLPSRNKSSLETQKDSGILTYGGNQDDDDYNGTYPLTTPIRTNNIIKFKIGVVADQDKDSKEKDKDYTWFSLLKRGYLTYDSINSKVTVEWFDEVR